MRPSFVLVCGAVAVLSTSIVACSHGIRQGPHADRVSPEGMVVVATPARAGAVDGRSIDMKPESVALKGDWIPLPALLRWIPELGSDEGATALSA